MPFLADLHWPRTAQQWGLAGTLLLFFSAFQGIAMAQTAILIVLCAFCFVIATAQPKLRYSLIVWLTLAILVWITLRSVDADLNAGIQASELKDRYWAWIRFAMFIPLGYFLHLNERYITAAVLLAAAGLAIHTLLHSDWQTLNPSAETFERLGFGFTINTFALLGYCASLGLFLIRPIFGYDTTLQALKTLTWLTGFLITAYLTLHTGSKSVFLMMAATVISLWLTRNSTAPLFRHRREWIILLLSALILAAGTASLWENRFKLTNEGYLTPLEDTLANATPYQSIGARIYLTHRGLEYWASAPLSGHGLFGPQKAIQSADNQSMNSLAHLHSLYVELGVSWGLAGLALFAGLWILMIRATLNRLKKNDTLAPLARWLFLCWLSWLVWSLTEVRFLHSDGWMQWLILSSLAFAFHLQQCKDYR